MLLAAFGQSFLKIGRRDCLGGEALAEPVCGRQDVTDTDIGQQLTGHEKRPVSQTQKRVDCHIVGQWPEWRDNRFEGCQVREQLLGGEPGHCTGGSCGWRCGVVHLRPAVEERVRTSLIRRRQPAGRRPSQSAGEMECRGKSRCSRGHKRPVPSADGKSSG